MNISKLSDGQREGTICSKSLFSQINLKGKIHRNLLTITQHWATAELNLFKTHQTKLLRVTE